MPAMSFIPLRLALPALLWVAAAAPLRAESLASSASVAGSASLGSASDSVQGSSDSSRNDRRAEGDYRVIEVAEPSDRAGMLRLRLRPTDPVGERDELLLTLPQQALARRALVAGDVVSVHRRPYGMEFARADTREAFFLVLADEWHRELDPRPVTF